MTSEGWARGHTTLVFSAISGPGPSPEQGATVLFVERIIFPSAAKQIVELNGWWVAGWVGEWLAGGRVSGWVLDGWRGGGLWELRGPIGEQGLRLGSGYSKGVQHFCLLSRNTYLLTLTPTSGNSQKGAGGSHSAFGMQSLHPVTPQAPSRG